MTKCMGVEVFFHAKIGVGQDENFSPAHFIAQSLGLYIIFSIVSYEEDTEMGTMRNFCKGSKLWALKECLRLRPRKC